MSLSSQIGSSRMNGDRELGTSRAPCSYSPAILIGGLEYLFPYSKNAYWVIFGLCLCLDRIIVLCFSPEHTNSGVAGELTFRTTTKSTD